MFALNVFFFCLILNIKPYFSPEDGDRMFFQKLASTDESTWRHNPEEHYHPHHCEDLKSNMDEYR
jgi:hypothetical protein